MTNENKYLENPTYEYVLSSSNDTSTGEDILIKKLIKIPALHVPIHSNSLNNQIIGDSTNAMFIVQ